MKASIIILNYNSEIITKQLAKKLEKYNLLNKIIVVDNCSTDQSFHNLKQIESNKIIVVKTEKNGGYSYGNNYGFKFITDEDVVFIANPDIDIEKKDISIILEKFKMNSNYSVITGVEYDINKKISNRPIWHLKTYKEDFLNCFSLWRFIKRKRKSIQVNYLIDLQEIEMIKGSFFGIRTKDFESIKGFDEGVFLFCEERIISKKVKSLLHKKIGLATGARYYHNHSVSINKTYSKQSSKIKILYKSILYYNEKYNKIGKIKKNILKIAMKISIFEYEIKDFIYKIIKG